MSSWPDEAYKRAAKKFDTLGPLGVTAADHRAIGSTPPEELSKNPGKTLLDLMTDEQILDYLRKEKELIEKYSAENYKEDRAVQDFLCDRKRALELSIKLLRRKGRLPKEFSNFSPN